MQKDSLPLALVQLAVIRRDFGVKDGHFGVKHGQCEHLSYH